MPESGPTPTRRRDFLRSLGQATAVPSERYKDALHTRMRIGFDLVLPDPNNVPPSAPEPTEIPDVSQPILQNLRTPERRHGGTPPWEAVSVPEVTIDEDRHL